MSQLKRLEQLRPEVKRKVLELGAILKDKYGIGISVGQTLRTAEEVRDLIEAGRTSPSVKTDWHQLGRAVDLYLTDAPGHRIIPATEDEKNKYLLMAQEAEILGFRQIGWTKDAGGKWSPRMIQGKKGVFWDCFHLEWRGPYKTMAEALKAETPLA